MNGALARSGLLRALVLTLVLAIAAALLPAPAGAHAFLTRTSPQAGERLDAGPSFVMLQFSEPVAGGGDIRIRTASGVPVAVERAELVQDGLVLRAAVAALGPDIYLVSWQVQADDGHLTAGEFAFGVGAGGQLPAVAGGDGASIAWGAALARWLFLIGLLLVSGALLSERFIWAPVGRARKVAIPELPVAWLLVLALAGAALQLLIVARQFVAIGTPPGDGARPPLLALFTARPGLLALGQVVLLGYALQLVLIRRARRWALLPLGLALVVAAARGHAGVATWWALPADIAHLGAIALWTGALAHLLLVARRLCGDARGPTLAAGLRRYATAALALVVVALVGGFAVALAFIARPVDLVATGYGRVLLVKLLAVVGTLGLALAARRALSPGHDPDFRRLRRLASAEGLLLLATIAVAAALANTPPPRAVTAAENLLGPPPVAAPAWRQAAKAGWLTVSLAATDGQWQVRVVAPGGEPASDARIAATGAAPGGQDIAFVPRSCGPGCATTAFSWEAGTTTLAVTATSADWEGGTVRFVVPWPLPPEDPNLLADTVATMRAQPRFMLDERVSSGPTAATDNTFPISGEQFMASEPYAGGGASDVRRATLPNGMRGLTFYISGSDIWVTLELDGAGRLRRETIVTPGHLLERTFSYDAASGAAASPAYGVLAAHLAVTGPESAVSVVARHRPAPSPVRTGAGGIPAPPRRCSERLRPGGNCAFPSQRTTSVPGGGACPLCGGNGQRLASGDAPP